MTTQDVITKKNPHPQTKNPHNQKIKPNQNLTSKHIGTDYSFALWYLTFTKQNILGGTFVLTISLEAGARP